MNASPTRVTTALRSLQLTLLTGALFLQPMPLYAAAEAPCLAALQPGSVVAYGYLATPLNQGQTGVRNAPISLDLTVKFKPDGTALATGSIQSSTGAAITTATAPYVPMLAVSKQIVDASCADLDGDGTAGLARLEADFRDIATGDRVPVVLTPVKHDVDDDGVYVVDVRIGDETLTGDTRFRLDDDR